MGLDICNVIHLKIMLKYISERVDKFSINLAHNKLGLYDPDLNIIKDYI